MKPFQYFLLKLVVLFAFVFVFDFLIGNTLSYFYFRQKRGEQYLITYSIEKTKADFLIFGSSRANHHYRPNIFEKRLDLSCYNAGLDGCFILYNYAVLKAILRRYSPKIIILDFRRREFAKSQDNYDRLSFLLPYYRSHPEIRSIIELKSPYEKFKLLSSIYPYNSSMLIIAGANAMITKKRREDISGYVPLKGIWNSSIQIDENSVNYELDSTLVKTYESFIQDCIYSKAKLYIICSPYFIKFNHTDFSVTVAKKIAKKYNVKFLDYSKDSIFINNSKLFFDPNHLNDEGAILFSNMLIDSISEVSHRLSTPKSNSIVF